MPVPTPPSRPLFRAAVWVITERAASRHLVSVTVETFLMLKRRYTVAFGAGGVDVGDSRWLSLVPAAGGDRVLRVPTGAGAPGARVARSVTVRSFGLDAARKFFELLARAPGVARDLAEATGAAAATTTAVSEATATSPSLRPRKRAIPRGVKQQVWNRHIGKRVGAAMCPICQSNEITQMHFHAAHIVSEAHGGATDVTNLMPTCAQCNLSCGTRNLLEYRDMLRPAKE